MLDVGRGRWPHEIRWNWGGGAGRGGDHVIGLQVGGKWTEGTGFTENGIIVDGRLTKLGRELTWDYDWDDPMRPWRVDDPGGQLHAVLAPRFDKHSKVGDQELGSETHQVFGTWSGTLATDDGLAARVRRPPGVRRGSPAGLVSSPTPFPDFAVACGEEGSDPLVHHDGRVVRVDEFAASGHLEHQDADLASVAALGVDVWRYGVPWRVTEPAPGHYDWTQWDRALAACERHGLRPVVDLCHFGLPDHYPGFCEPSWVEGFCRYVDAFLARYPEPVWFTPVNEPGITAVAAGLLGAWNDRRASRPDYFVALANVVTANLEALARIRADRDGWWIGAEGFGTYVGTGAEGRARADAERALQQLVWDLHFGFEPPPEVADFHEAVDEATLERLARLAIGTDHVVAGHDFYPVGVATFGGAPASGYTIAERVASYRVEAERWHRRYGAEFWVSETSNLGLPVADQTDWLDTLSTTLVGMRADGLPVRGICWYSRGDQYDWDTMLTVPVGTVTEVGLFDADRRPRPVADAFARLARRHRDDTADRATTHLERSETS